MHIPHAFCMVHEQEMVIRRTGVTIEARLKDGTGYYKINADEWCCTDSGCLIAVPARQPIVQHFQPEYDSVRVDKTATLT